jgi:hypothetical protein
MFHISFGNLQIMDTKKLHPMSILRSMVYQIKRCVV